jgi:excinuclease ABC subunit C
MKFEKRADGIAITDKAGRTIPCMDYYIGLCPAPCTLEDSKIEEHTNHLDKLRLFLKGESLGIFSELEEKMQLHAKNLEFEEAQKIKYSIESLRYIHERQKVRDLPGGDMDIVVQYEKYEKHFI